MGAINKAWRAPASRYMPNNACSRVSTPAAAFSTVFRNISHINPQFQALLRMDGSQILHQKVDTLIHPKYLRGFIADLKTADPCFGTEIVFLNSTGATRPLPTSVMRFKNAYLIRVFSQRSDTALDIGGSMPEIGGGLVHDLNNVVGGMAGYSELLHVEASDLRGSLAALLDNQDPEAIRTGLQLILGEVSSLAKILDYIGALRRSAHHMTSILRGFSIFCSAQSGTEPGQHLEIVDAVRSAVAMGKGIIHGIEKQKGISINVRLEGPDDRICAYGDSEQLQRILVNLIKNAALEFKEPNNNINIEWAAVENAAHEKFVEIRVGDSGDPIPKHVADKLFREKVESTHNGTGIGLLTCAQIIHGFGGEIRYQSIPDKCFVITLRIAG